MPRLSVRPPRPTRPTLAPYDGRRWPHPRSSSDRCLSHPYSRWSNPSSATRRNDGGFPPRGQFSHHTVGLTSSPASLSIALGGYLCRRRQGHHPPRICVSGMVGKEGVGIIPSPMTIFIIIDVVVITLLMMLLLPETLLGPTSSLCPPGNRPGRGCGNGPGGRVGP